jgi:hypothetical protein
MHFGVSAMKARTTIQFPRDAAAALNSIRSRTRFNDATDVIRAALSAYDELLEMVDLGFKIFVDLKSGERLSYSPYAPFSYDGLMPFGAKEAVEAPRTFVFAADGIARFGSIRKRSFLTSNADVIRAALAAYDELLRVELTGDSIIMVRGEEREVSYSPNKPINRDAVRCVPVGDVGVALRNDQPAAVST